MNSYRFILLCTALFGLFYSVISSAQQVAVPSYFSPHPTCSFSGCYWDKLNASAPMVGIAILNPHSGVGTPNDPDFKYYGDKNKAARAKGIKVFGYVYTGGGWRDIELVKTEIKHYYDNTWYGGVDGIFFDEVSSDCSSANNYYKPLTDFVKTKFGGKTILNPGTSVPECFKDKSDILVNFEDSYSNYQSQSEWDYEHQGWEKTHPSNFWHIVHDVTSEVAMSEVVKLSKQRNADYVYVTDIATLVFNDDGTPLLDENGNQVKNYYDALPTYWTSELSTVAAGGTVFDDFNSSPWSLSPKWVIEKIGSGLNYKLPTSSRSNIVFTANWNARSDLSSADDVFNLFFRSTCRITGNFDLEVNFQLPSSNKSYDGMRFRLDLENAVTRTSVSFMAMSSFSQNDVVNSDPTNSTKKIGEYVTASFNNGADPKKDVTFVPINLLAGKLRLKREGSIMTASYYNSASRTYTDVSSRTVDTSPLIFKVGIQSRDKNRNRSIIGRSNYSVTADDVKFNSGSCM